MARADAIKKLRAQLVQERDNICRRCGQDLEGLSHGSSSDIGETALYSESDEVNSQIASLGAVSLTQIDGAIRAIDAGTYGICEGCNKKIPLERLKAIPFTTTCVPCKQSLERSPNGNRGTGGEQWARVAEHEDRLADRKQPNSQSL